MSAPLFASCSFIRIQKIPFLAGPSAQTVCQEEEFHSTVLHMATNTERPVHGHTSRSNGPSIPSQRKANTDGLSSKGTRRTASRLVHIPWAAFSAVYHAPQAVSGMVSASAKGIRHARAASKSMSGSLEFQMAKKLFGAFANRFSGFLELGALIASMTLLFWVSGLFLGLAFCSVMDATSCCDMQALKLGGGQVFVAAACLYVLICAVSMNWCLDRVRVYLRDCLVLRVCSVAIPTVSVLQGLKFTTGQ
eukprot:752106-Hanusia_phi.AAC.2